jgi:hypothetical protein
LRCLLNSFLLNDKGEVLRQIPFGYCRKTRKEIRASGLTGTRHKRAPAKEIKRIKEPVKSTIQTKSAKICGTNKSTNPLI